MSGPTKAAMRAAESVYNELLEFDISRNIPSISSIAEMIDERAGLPELIQAVRNAIDDITTLITICKAITEESPSAWVDDYRNILKKLGELP